MQTPSTRILRTRIKPDGTTETLISRPAPESVVIQTSRGERTVPTANRPNAVTLSYAG